MIWGMVYNKLEHLEKTIKIPAKLALVPRWLRNTLQSRRIEKAAGYQGLGRHTKDQVIEMGFKDLRALSNYLGKTIAF